MVADIQIKAPNESYTGPTAGWIISPRLANLQISQLVELCVSGRELLRAIRDRYHDKLSEASQERPRYEVDPMSNFYRNHQRQFGQIVSQSEPALRID